MVFQKMTEQEAIEKARSYFLRQDNLYGCAETTLMALKAAYGLPEPADSSPAMALNGGVAYSGGLCGAISGAALAIGMLAGRRIQDHKEAKRTARRLVAHLMDQFKATYHTTNCRELIHLDIRDELHHQQFIESGVWRTRCMGQIEFAVRSLSVLGEEEAWEQAINEIESLVFKPAQVVTGE
jgi:C_GCAxxG_C_C family probable redox protein